MTNRITNEFDETKLTAYVLGELDEREIELIERAIEEDDILRSEFEAIRATVSLLQDQFSAEPAPMLTEQQRETIEAGPKAVLNEPSIFTMSRTRMVGSGLAAAAMIALTATMWVYWDRDRPGANVAFEMPPTSESMLNESNRSDQSFAQKRMAPNAVGEMSAPRESQTAVRFDDDAGWVLQDRTGEDAQESVASAVLIPVDVPSDALALGLDSALTQADLNKNDLEESDVAPWHLMAPDSRLESKGQTAAVPPAADEKDRQQVQDRDDLWIDKAGKPTEQIEQEKEEGLVVVGRTSDDPNVINQLMDKILSEEMPLEGQGLSGQPANEPGSAGGGRGVDTGGRTNTDLYRAAIMQNHFTLEVTGGSDVIRNSEVVDALDRRRTETESLEVFPRMRGRDTFGNESYAPIIDNPWTRPVGEKALSTFSIDVDTASYANMRRFITNGALPPKDSVRLEEMINYFSYDYEAPDEDAEQPFTTSIEIADAPWNPKHRLARIGLKGRVIEMDKRPASNLVFLIDVSGSMRHANKLPLLRESMKMLVENLNGDDMISIVVYAGSSGLVLDPTHCDARESILNAIDRLEAGGSTNGGAGIELAYRLAIENFISGGVNRVILATDGDFNVGVSSNDALLRLIESKRDSGVFLSVLGFGSGNIKDDKMELLADKGNGNYAYIDSIREARKVLVEEATSMLVTIAKDVKLQIEFNPSKVGAYRLIGYANRMLEAKDFNDDRKDAGEIGAGHTVTALYEIVPPGVSIEGDIDELKYQTPDFEEAEIAVGLDVVESDELFTVKLRYKQPDGDVSTKIEIPVHDEGGSLASASDDFKFAASVAAFGMVLRDSEYRGTADCDLVLELAIAGSGDERKQHEAVEFITDFTHYVKTANVDLASANARAWIRLDLTDAELGRIMFYQSIPFEPVFDAIERARAIPELAELADELHRHLASAQQFLTMARLLAPKQSYRGEFIDLVRKAKQLGAK